MVSNSESNMPLMVITGTSKGAGKGIAEYFLANGFRVAGCSRSEKTILHENYFHALVDVSDESQVRTWVRSIKKNHGRIDVLVSNAGILNSFLHMALTPAALLQSFLNVNVAGTFYVCREVAKAMLPYRKGSIITLSSIMTQLHEPGTAAYAASKSAITEMTKVLAREVAPMNINCNVIAPSFIKTDATSSFSEEWANALMEKQTIKRPVTVSEICNIISFFAAPESQCITGQVIYMGLVC